MAGVIMQFLFSYFTSENSGSFYYSFYLFHHRLCDQWNLFSLFPKCIWYIVGANKMDFPFH